MPSDSFLDVIKRDWLDDLPATDPGGGKPWRDPESGAVIAGDTVLVASKAHVATETAGLVSSTEAGQPNGYAVLDSNGLIPPAVLPEGYIPVIDAGTLANPATIIEDAGDLS